MAENKSLAQAFHDRILNEKRYEVSKDLVCEDIVFYLNQNEPLYGMKEFQRHMDPIQQAFPDLSYSTLSLIEENNVVALHWAAKGTHTNYLGDIPATGKSVEIRGLSLFHIHEGGIQENIVYFDETQIPKQLGVL